MDYTGGDALRGFIEYVRSYGSTVYLAHLHEGPKRTLIRGEALDDIGISERKISSTTSARLSRPYKSRAKEDGAGG